MRRGPALLPLGLAAAVLLAACAGGTTSAAPDPATPSAPSEPPGSPAPAAETTAAPAPRTSGPQPSASCFDATLERLPLPERVGRLLMAGVPSTGADAATLDVLREHAVGSVILMGRSEGGVAATADVTSDVRDALGASTLVAVDQEGGEVRRLTGPGFTPMPSAQEQATWGAARLQREAATWGAELRRAGVDVDLAPVADVVPEDVGDANAPIGALRRGYGSDPEQVGARVTAFVAGMRGSGVQTALKHFPGLGRVRENTDFAGDVVDRATRRGDPLLAPFAAGVRAGAGWVMVSSATYERIDPRRLAVFSPAVIGGMVRDDLGFRGLVVSDDLGAAQALADVPPGQRALRFLRAGGDVVITVDPALVPAMAEAVLAAAAEDPRLRSHVEDAARRVLAAQQAAGRLECS